jgi:hypothetical protein
MPIYIHLSNLILDKQIIQAKYPGGIEQFRIDFETEADNNHQEDERLLSLATMNSDEFDINLLTSKGLSFDWEKRSCSDFVILNRYGGNEWPVDWLEDNSVFAWHIDACPISIAAAEKIANESMDSIRIRFERGENPFATIW